MLRRCDFCKIEYEARSPRSRFHDDACRLRAHRQRKVAPVVELPVGDDQPGAVVAALRAELDRVGRTETVLGRSALLLAAQIDAGGHTGSALAALHREFRAAVTDAMRGAGAPRSAVAGHRDELAARRQRRG